MVSLNIYKNSANKFDRKTGFKIENEIEDQDQSFQNFLGILTQVFCTFGPHLVILAWTGDELNLTLKVKVNHPPKQYRS